MLVSRFMTRHPLTVAPETRLGEAVRLMEERGFRHLPVLSHGEVVGMLSDRDVRLGTGGQEPEDLGLPADSSVPRLVSDVMHAPAVCVDSDERGPAAAARMIEHRIGALPVMEGVQLAGIVTETNLVTAYRDLCRDPAHQDELDGAVEEIMRSVVVTLAPDDSVDEAIRRCTDWRIRHIPVLADDEELVGIVSDRDIRLSVGRALVADQQASASGGKPTDTPRIKSIMSHEVLTVDPREAISRAATLMLDGHCSALPVTVDGMLMGILTRTDILEHYGSVA
jgi:CBS domain-containing protein